MSKSVFVFGSNLAGRHGAGSALHARKHYRAQYGIGTGPTGDAYAIPTKDRQLRTMPIADIKPYVDEFIAYARARPEVTFQRVAIGTGLAGYTNEDMLPLFDGIPANVVLPQAWRDLAAKREMTSS